MKPKIHFLVEEDIFQENLTELTNEIVNQCHDLHRIKYKPFIKDQDWPVDPKDHNLCVVTLGSINLLKSVEKNCRWQPGFFATWENYDYTNIVNQYHKFLINSRPTFYPYKYLKEHFDILSKPFKSGLFIRSNSGLKQFTGGSFESSKLLPDAPDNLLCVVAESKNIASEFRFFISGKEILGTSMYRNHNGNFDPKCSSLLNGQDLEHYKDCLNLCNFILTTNDYSPDVIYCLDIGTEYIKYFDIFIPGIIEINAFSCSGQYGVNPKKIIEKCAELAYNSWKEYQ